MRAMMPRNNKPLQELGLWILPLDSLQTPSLESTERICAMAENDKCYRLAADVIGCPEEYHHDVSYAVDNTVVSATMDVAREICFA